MSYTRAAAFNGIVSDIISGEFACDTLFLRPIRDLPRALISFTSKCDTESGNMLTQYLSTQSLVVSKKVAESDWLTLYYFCGAFHLFKLRNREAIKLRIIAFGFSTVSTANISLSTGVVEGVLHTLATVEMTDREKTNLFSHFERIYDPLSMLLSSYRNETQGTLAEEEQYLWLRFFIWQKIYVDGSVPWKVIELVHCGLRSSTDLVDEFAANVKFFKSMEEEFGKIQLSQRRYSEEEENESDELVQDCIYQMNGVVSHFRELSRRMESYGIKSALEKEYLGVLSHPFASVHATRDEFNGAQKRFRQLRLRAQRLPKKYIRLLSTPRWKIVELFLILIQLDIPCLCSMLIIREAEPRWAKFFPKDHQLVEIHECARQHWNQRCAASE